MKKLSKYQRIALVSGIMIPVLILASLLILLPAYNLVGNSSQPTQNSDATLHRTGVSITVLKVLLIGAFLTLFISLIADSIQKSKKK